MSYLLEGLLRMRRMREDRALREFTQARAQMAAAATALETARRELQEFRAWRPQEEARLWQGILGQEISTHDLDVHKKRLQGLADAEKEREGRVQQAEKAWQTARDACEQKRQLHVSAMRNVQKLEEHKKLEMKREEAEAERLLEAELEDSRVHLQTDF